MILAFSVLDFFGLAELFEVKIIEIFFDLFALCLFNLFHFLHVDFMLGSLKI